MTPKKPLRYVLNWTVEDVLKWLHKYAGVQGEKYAYLFEENGVTGSCLRMMTDEWLLRMGIMDAEDRYLKLFLTFRNVLMGHIYRMRLKYDAVDLSNMLKSK
ncbi:unnamed protein product [Protopolystoma xenopodis]|uniref:SAM domain-containing protein n=1 Tax=Protopolystoma xenopodis TaxID=117903 RepID=A0A3S5A5K7_9PLAT|nr:unnamed protein product [Protopolystoma xenopodis]